MGQELTQGKLSSWALKWRPQDALQVVHKGLIVYPLVVGPEQGKEWQKEVT